MKCWGVFYLSCDHTMWLPSLWLGARIERALLWVADHILSHASASSSPDGSGQTCLCALAKARRAGVAHLTGHSATGLPHSFEVFCNSHLFPMQPLVCRLSQKTAWRGVLYRVINLCWNALGELKQLRFACVVLQHPTGHRNVWWAVGVGKGRSQFVCSLRAAGS